MIVNVDSGMHIKKGAGYGHVATRPDSKLRKLER